MERGTLFEVSGRDCRRGSIRDAPDAVYPERQHTNGSEDNWSQEKGTHYG